MRSLNLLLLAACGSPTVDPDDATSPVIVDDWVGAELRREGATDALPFADDGFNFELSLTDEPRGLLTHVYGDEGARDAYDVVVDDFSDSRWLLVVEDGGCDVDWDCVAEGDGMTCDGLIDGTTSAVDFVRD